MSLSSWLESNIVDPIVKGVVDAIVEELKAEADRVIDTTTDNLLSPIDAISTGIGGIVASVIQGIKNLLPFGGLLK